MGDRPPLNPDVRARVNVTMNGSASGEWHPIKGKPRTIAETKAGETASWRVLANRCHSSRVIMENTTGTCSACTRLWDGAASFLVAARLDRSSATAEILNSLAAAR